MNKILKFASLLTLSSLMVVGCGNNPGSESPTIDCICLSGDYQTYFDVNESFSYEGLIVTAIYSDDSSIDVTDYQITSPDMSTAGEKDVTVTYLGKSDTYTITVEEDTYKGYITLSYSRLEIKRDASTQYQLLPTNHDFEPEGTFPYEYHVSGDDVINISKYGTITSNRTTNGSCVVTCICTDPNYPNISASCRVTVKEELPVKEKGYVRVDDYDSLKDGDILVMASPEHGVSASLDTLHSKLHEVSSTFSSDKKNITNLGEGTIEFVLGIEKNGMTLEAQTGEYLICTHQGKVKLDSGKSTNKYWDIHANYDLMDGAVIENIVLSLGYFMYNVDQRYFSTYIDNSITEFMKLPFLYRLEEI